VLWAAPSAWPKFKEDEQQYLDDHFNLLKQQVEALNTQLQMLNAQLQALLKNQAQFQALLDRQQKSLQDLDQMVVSMRMGTEEDTSKLKTAITQLRNETRDAFVKLGGGSVPSSPGAGAGASVAPAPSGAAQGYVITMEDNTVMLETTSLVGIHQGSRLVLYKSTDLNTRVGVLAVTQVMDGGKSKAEIVHLEAGVTPEFSDVVRLE
jgi:hypothetical protein